MRSLALFILIIFSARTRGQQPLFTRLPATQTGISFTNEIHEDASQNVLAYEYFYNGGGVALGDINNDGLPDIFFTANDRPCRLYLNEGGFHFRDITKTAGVRGRGDWKTGCTLADVNGDGWLDIYVCYSGKGDGHSRRNELYINNHDNTFTESARSYGLADTACSTQAIFFDYDLDGDLDCYVLNHNIKAYKNVGLHYLKNDVDPLAGDHLYRNDGGHFTDVSRAAGISGNPISFGLGIGVSDLNGDGWPDIYVSNDYTEQDYLYINNRDGTFSQRELYAFGHLSQFSMGNDIADINNDGLPDIVTLDMLPEDNRRQKLLQGQENYELYEYMIGNGFHYQYMRNMLQLNNGNGTFSEIGQLAGMSNTDWSWSPLLADLDDDGNKDLFITNGYMRDYTNKDFLKYWGEYLVKQAVHKDSIRYWDIVQMMPSTNVANYAFRNTGGLHFENVSEEWGLKQFSLSNGAAYADLDGDGDLDIVVNNINEPASVYRNEGSGGHHLNIRLRGADLNRFGLGAKLYCYSGGQSQYLEQMPTRGYQSSVSEILHFGLGSATEADSVRIVWLDGKSQLLLHLPSGPLLTIDQKDALPYREPLKASPSLFKPQAPLIDYVHSQPEYNDFKRQPLMPLMFSPCGPQLAAADINGDGLEDVFVASAQGQAGRLFLQTTNGFVPSPQSDIDTDTLSETSAALFFDADGDGRPDLYCVSGGYNDFDSEDTRLSDRLFLNEGSGHFHRTADRLPAMLGSKSCVAAADWDGDGDLDLFVGGRVVPGAYPQTPRSWLLRNEGKGFFTDVTDSVAPGLRYAGMVTSAVWYDADGDGRKDLIIAGEWMAPSLYLNDGKRLQPADTSRYGFAGAPSGWYNTLTLADLDGDGDSDLVAGNWGLNSQLKCSSGEPLQLVYKDFDNNGSIDPFLCCYMQGRSYPYVSRDELLDEIYPMRKKFTSYKSFADATLPDIFTADDLKEARTLTATNLATLYFENRKGKFVPHELPVEAQFSPVYRILAHDFNGDGTPDLLLLGNQEYTRLKLGKMDANFGTLLLNDGHGHFDYRANRETGLFVPGDVKDARLIHVNHSDYLLLGINNAALLNYKLVR